MKEVGVDVEELIVKSVFEALAQHAFHAEEYQTWQQQDQDPMNIGYDVWTTK